MDYLIFLIKINKFFSCFIVKNTISREMQFTFISFLVIYIFSSTLTYANEEDGHPFSVPVEEESEPIPPSVPRVSLRPIAVPPMGANNLMPLLLPAASIDLPIRQSASAPKGSMLHRLNESNH